MKQPAPYKQFVTKPACQTFQVVYKQKRCSFPIQTQPASTLAGILASPVPGASC